MQQIGQRDGWFITNFILVLDCKCVNKTKKRCKGLFCTLGVCMLESSTNTEPLRNKNNKFNITLDSSEFFH